MYYTELGFKVETRGNLYSLSPHYIYYSKIREYVFSALLAAPGISGQQPREPERKTLLYLDRGDNICYIIIGGISSVIYMYYTELGFKVETRGNLCSLSPHFIYYSKIREYVFSALRVAPPGISGQQLEEPEGKTLLDLCRRDNIFSS